MTREKIMEHLKTMHEKENELNAEMTKAEKQIVHLRKLKAKLAKRISENMRGRNRLINKL